jgi:peptide/nickel transport system ATP-binding protein
MPQRAADDGGPGRGAAHLVLQPAVNPILECVELRKHFRLGKTSSLHAVDDVSFSIAEGESVGLVGESGCGKSTLARIITRTLDPTSGDLIFRGRNIGFIAARKFAETQFRPQIQMVFQDAADSLNPRFTAFDAIAEPVRRLFNVSEPGKLAAQVRDAALKTGLPEELLGRYPHQLSGGQKARVGIARAIVTKPDLLVLDEPTAALDVSVQATVLKLLAELRKTLGMSYLFVSHDLNVVRMLCERVIVMYLGKIVELGPTRALFARPAHPYTRALVDAIPSIGADASKRELLNGEPRSPVNPDPKVCRFFGRCARQKDRCRTEAPLLYEVGVNRQAACHFARID